MSLTDRLQPWRLGAVALVLFVSAITASPSPAASREIKIQPGRGEFQFVDEKGDRRKEITVFTYLPQALKANEVPIVFVMHGHHRSAKGYRNDWAQHADKYGFMVLAPLFDEEQWGHGQYSYASVQNKNGSIRDPSKWSFSVIEHLFDAVKQATGNQNARYFLYGFSEGGQFVHRFVLLMPEARYARAVIGTPGWYTMPRFDVAFPYGLRGAPVNAQSLKRSLGRDVVLLLGAADTDPNHDELRQTPQAEAQGPHRVARGRTFFKEGKHRAAELKTPFGWRMQMVPGAEHNPRQMSGAAADLLMAH
jgi:poly(3-hydroxybutyrate) depolymerase